MLIDVLIQHLEKSGELMAYRPSRTRLPAKRRAYLTKEAMKDLDDDYSPTNFFAGRHFPDAALQRRVLGGLVWRVWRQGKWEGGFLKRLEPPPHEIWEMKVTEPRPQVRLFGRFAAPDTLILTKFHLRDKLGDKGSREWATAMNQCESAWNALVPDQPRPSETMFRRTVMSTRFKPKHSKAGELAYMRVRDLAFDAVMSLWQRRSKAGLTQKELAAKIGCSPSHLNRSLRGPANWTLRTLAEFTDALDGEVEIRVAGLEDPLPNAPNFDAYEAHKVLVDDQIGIAKSENRELAQMGVG